MASNFPSLPIVGILLVSILLTGAVDKKSSTHKDKSEYYVRFRINGTGLDFSHFQHKARHDSIKIASRTSRWLEIVALNLKNIPEAIAIGLWDTAQVRPGIYRDNQPAYTYLPSALLSYQPKKGLSYQSGGLFNATCDPIYKDSTIVIITELTDKKVTGTFSGVLYQISSDGFPPSPENVIRITDGSFVLPMRQ